MRSGIRLGRIAGIDVAIDWSLLIIFFMITFSLAVGLFPAWHPDWDPPMAWATALAAATLFFSSVLLHELSHALVGRAKGVEIKRITLFMFGGMAHMETEPPSWRAELWMALVGPATSLALGLLFLFAAGLVTGPLDVDPREPQRALSALGPLPTLLLWLGPVNIILGLFNLVPGFPLDGGRVLRAIMWAFTGNLRVATRWASRAGQAFAWLLMSFGFLMVLGLRVPVLGGGLVNGLWLAFIGWFLNNAALVSYRQLLVREALEDVPVARLMQTQFTRVNPQMLLSALVDEYLMPTGQRAFPVEEDDRLVGMVSLHDIRKHDRDSWNRTTVGAIMTPVKALTSVTPRQDAVEALAILGRREVSQLPVVENDKLVGLIRREDILKWLTLHTDRGLGEQP